MGHATRSLVVVRKLREAGEDVQLVSGGTAADFLRSQGEETLSLVDGAVPRVSGGEMKGALLWYVRSWLAYRRTLPRARRLLLEYAPDVVVGDEEFTTVSAAIEARKPAVMVSDELELGFARGWAARRFERRVEQWYQGLQEGVRLLVVPEKGEDAGNVRRVGPIVRGLTGGRDETRARFGLPRGRMVLLCMSGSGIGDYLFRGTEEGVRSLDDPDAFLVVVGNRGARHSGYRVHDVGVVPDAQDLVAAADLVVSCAGKSTIDEAAAYGTPIVAIPIRNHAEQERNAASLGLRADDLGRLPSLVKEMVGRRSDPRPSEGAERAADLIRSVTWPPDPAMGGRRTSARL